MSRFARPVVERLRRLCLALPETTEAQSWGHPNFRAGKRTFCAFEVIENRPSIAFRVTAADLQRCDRGSVFFETPYGRGRWKSLWAEDELNWQDVELLLEAGYRHVASKRLVTILEAR